jgi:hypothetical protein
MDAANLSDFIKVVRCAATSVVKVMAAYDRCVRSAVYDPACVKTLEASGGSQQKNRTCSAGDSFMLERRSV